MEKVYCSDLGTSLSDVRGLEFNHDAQSWLVNWLLSKHNIKQAECVSCHMTVCGCSMTFFLETTKQYAHMCHAHASDE